MLRVSDEKEFDFDHKLVSDVKHLISCEVSGVKVVYKADNCDHFIASSSISQSSSFHWIIFGNHSDSDIWVAGTAERNIDSCSTHSNVPAILLKPVGTAKIEPARCKLPGYSLWDTKIAQFAHQNVSSSLWAGMLWWVRSPSTSLSHILSWGASAVRNALAFHR